MSIDQEEEAKSSSEEEFDFDPRKDIRYKEVLLTACPVEKHLKHHDVCLSDFKVHKFRSALMTEMRENPVSEPREVFDRTRAKFCEGMSEDENAEFSASLNCISRVTLMRKLRMVKEEAIGKMPKSQSKFFYLMYLMYSQNLVVTLPIISMKRMKNNLECFGF